MLLFQTQVIDTLRNEEQQPHFCRSLVSINGFIGLK